MNPNQVLEKANYYNNLTEYEREVLTTFYQLTKKIGRAYSYFYDEHTFGLGGFCIVKKNGVWAAYVDERGAFHGYTEYNDVYDLAIDLIGAMAYDDTCYCLNNFPKKEQFMGKLMIK